MNVKKIGLLLLIILALLALNVFAFEDRFGIKDTQKELVVNIRLSFDVSEGASVPTHFADSLKKAQQLLNKVFSSEEFKQIMQEQSFNDSAYSKSKKQCFEKIYDKKTGRILGSAVYDNLLNDKSVELIITIKNNGDKKTTMGLSSACVNKITTYDYWLVEGGELAQRLARHIAHEFVHIKGYRHDSKVEKAYKWGRKLNEDPAYGVGSIVGSILADWSKRGVI